jgi:DedD protein
VRSRLKRRPSRSPRHPKRRAFADRAEADAFAKRFAAQSAYVIPSEIPGKGIWFRVRAGDYATAKDAIAAKGNFEKQHGVIAYVVPPPPK